MKRDTFTAGGNQNASTEERRSISGAGLVKALTQPPILALLWVGVFIHLWSMFETLRTRMYKWDFSLYYLTAYAQSHGVNPYVTDLTSMAHHLGVAGLVNGNFLDVPFLVIAMEPLTWLSVPAAYWTWFTINVIALAVALLLLLRRNPSFDRRYLSAWLALALLYPPLGVHFYYAQSQIVVLLILVLMMQSMERKHQGAAGIMLGLVSILRAYPLALGGYFLIRRKWRALFYAAFAVLICFLLAVIAAGLDPWQAFFHQISVHFIYKHSRGPGNVALVQTVSFMLLLMTGSGSGFAFEVTRLLVAGLANLVILLISAKVTIDSWQRPDSDARVFSLWIVTMLLVSPVTWVHSLIILILPFTQLTFATAAGRASHRAMWTAVASYLMVAIATGWYQHVGSYRIGPVSAIIAELSPLSLLAAYVSMYWFVTDRELPMEEGAAVSA
jgi:uncharacterized membrane protein